jgi:hypothetical protein
MEFSGAQNDTSWLDIRGGKELVAFFGHDPMFHDGEIIQTVLNRRSASTISIHIWGMENVDPVRHAVVTLTFTDILDLQLENFSPQNVIGDLIIRPLKDLPERRIYYPRQQLPDDIEIELVPIYGLHGFIRAAAVSLSLVPGKPRDTIKDR